jgi:hypothetical protein
MITLAPTPLPVLYADLTGEQRRLVRERYGRKQGGLCYHCKRPFHWYPIREVEEAVINKALFPKNFFDHPVHLHHDHRTGLTLGAVHARCNAFLWQYCGE